MKIFIAIAGILTFAACADHQDTGKTATRHTTPIVYAKEPADSANYTHLKYALYLSKSGQLCERKLIMSEDSSCLCEFEVFYDSLFSVYTDDSVLQKPLNTVIDVASYTQLDSTEYSKDKLHVYYFYGNSEGGIRAIVDKADPATFKRLCEYRWGIDKHHVFYTTQVIEGLNLKTLQVLYPPDTSDHFIQYVKDDKHVFYENQIVKGADPKTFTVVSNKSWEAEDKHHQYQTGRQQ